MFYSYVMAYYNLWNDNNLVYRVRREKKYNYSTVSAHPVVNNSVVNSTQEIKSQ